MSAEVSSVVDLAGDLAGKYRRMASAGISVDPAVVDADLAAVLRDGYVILENLLTPDELDEIAPRSRRCSIAPGATTSKAMARNGFTAC